MKKIIILAAVLGLSACTHNKVDVHKIDDEKLTCSQLHQEINELKAMKKDIGEKRGFSGRNVGMALLFWPGVIVNEVNGHEAEELIKQRNDKLVNLHKQKGCK